MSSGFDLALALTAAIALLAYGLTQVIRRKPSLWNRGWPVFYGTGALLFGAAFLTASLFQFVQFVSE